MYTKHLLSALLIFPFSLWATGSTSDWTATSALQFQQLSDTRMTMGDNVISFVTSDLERMTLDANGNVGIRTTTPTDALEIGGDSNMNIRIGRWGALGILGNSIATVLGNNIKASNTDSNMKYITTTVDGAKAIKMQYNEGITFHTQLGSVTAGSNFTGYERMRIDNNGNVGIGITEPLDKLHISGPNRMGVVIGGPSSSAGAVGDLNFISSDQSAVGGAVYWNWSFRTDSWSSGPGDFVLYSHNGSSYTSPIICQADGDLILTSGNGAARNGNVGIGITTPSAKLHLIGDNAWGGGMRITNASNYWDVAVDGGGDRFYIGNDQSMDLVIRASSGNVGIGTAAPSHKLHVIGNVHASSFSAEPSFVWPDYVFEENYKLSEIEEVEKYIEKNHHLPEIPSAAEVKENGVDIVSMQAKLLRKIEELTLYVIEQNKQLEKQNKRIDSQQQEIINLKRSSIKTK
ncbi:hypothetical protein [Reichenbachiella sp.]|uniref:hypothetical protein n=1 Tax=Reichenbachiella sp. TaxID=2184521 RepID=UPI003298E9D1